MTRSTGSSSQMLIVALYLSSIHCLVTPTTAPYERTDYILLNCGPATNSMPSDDGRIWDTDANSKYTPPNIDSSTSAFTASEQDPRAPRVPFTTARIFQSQFTYTFPLSSGPKFLRLYFYPATYSNFQKTNSSFTVTAGGNTLLRNFSAFLTVSATVPLKDSLIKEYVVNVGGNQRLQVTFVPSPESYAFVNGIEIVSMPSNLYVSGAGHQASLVNTDQFFTLDHNTALETLYRLNVGGGNVDGGNDTGMYRMWQQDYPYIFPPEAGGFVSRISDPILYNNQTPAYTAPSIVYSTCRTMGNDSEANKKNNLTWLFTVDSGFRYLARLHFCEIQPLDVFDNNQRVFKVFINNQTAAEAVDVIAISGGNRIPIFRDYVIIVRATDGRQRKQDFWLALHPNLEANPYLANAILNGLEIFKLNQSDGNLAGPNPDPVAVAPPDASNPKLRTKNKGSSPPWVIIGSFIGGVFLISILALLIFRRRKKVKDSGATPGEPKSSWVQYSYMSKSSKTSASSLPSNLCTHFSLLEIRSATDNFSEDNLIGRGGFGNVYKGVVANGTVEVAVKRLNSSSKQGAHEFFTEIQMLSKLRFLHLVSLIGYCDDEGEMILVYEFMAKGTLRDHLYKTSNPPLPWKQRLQICIGAARGLHYLHTGAEHTIIHRDVKSTNILLDEKWVAKVSDFGLSKTGPDNVTQFHVSTAVKGSFGYMDPEYFRRQQLTEKSDVYSFGVVLLEVLSARPAVVAGLTREQVSLAAWGLRCMRNGTFDQIIDPNMKGHVAPACLRKFGEIIDSCLRENGIERPAMNDVVWSLEFALQLQEAAEKEINGGDAFGYVPLDEKHNKATDDEEIALRGTESSGIWTTESGGSSSVNGHDRGAVTTETVFSEINNPTAR